MYWILAAVFLLIALTVPKLRTVGIVGSVILGLLLGWGMLQRVRAPEPTAAPERGRTVSPAYVVQALPVSELQVENLRLLGNGAPFELRGSITNTSRDLRLKSLTVDITRRDCYEGALDPSGCATLWQGRQWVELVLAPGEHRELSNAIWTRAETRVRGTIQDEIRIVSANGEPVPPSEREDQPQN